MSLPTTGPDQAEKIQSRKVLGEAEAEPGRGGRVTFRRQVERRKSKCKDPEGRDRR